MKQATKHNKRNTLYTHLQYGDQTKKDLTLIFSQEISAYYWSKKNKYYHNRLKKFYQFSVVSGSRVLQIGCHNSYLLDAVKPLYGVGVDSNPDNIVLAKKLYSKYEFILGIVDDVQVDTPFDYIILSCSTMQLYDVQNFLERLQRLCHRHTRIIIDSYSYVWEPILWLAQKCGLRRKTVFKNWVSRADLVNFLYCADFEVVTQGEFTLLPCYIPLVSMICNAIIARIPGFTRLCLNQWIVARQDPKVFEPHKKNVTVSIIIPCKNEKGNIEAAVKSCPNMGARTDLIFIDGHAVDGTLQEIERVARKYPEKAIRFCVQDGSGKGDAVRKGFDMAHGDVLMIQDGDLTTPPQELTKFFKALVSGKGEFINGSRLVYGMESEAMRFLNLLANFFFSALFSWTLNQKVKDTLCGTKVLWKKDYKLIADNRSFFGNFDPFGDFDLLFGAAKLQLKILDMPVHYKRRQYGKTQIRRFYHGLILLYMSFVALRKFKLY